MCSEIGDGGHVPTFGNRVPEFHCAEAVLCGALESLHERQIGPPVFFFSLLANQRLNLHTSDSTLANGRSTINRKEDKRFVSSSFGTLRSGSEVLLPEYSEITITNSRLAKIL